MRTAILCVAMAFALLGSTISAAQAEPTKETPKMGIQSIAIYTDLIECPEWIPFFKASGYNTYQCWDMAWIRPPDTHETLYKNMDKGIERLQEAGFKVYVLLSTNMNQKQTADQADYQMTFDPADEALMKERLEYIRTAVRRLQRADGFTITPGDPGGHENASPEQFIKMAREMMSIVRKEAPKAEAGINLWAIGYWDHMPDPFKVALWDKEVELCRKFIKLPDMLAPGVGVEFPLHNYYRSLALKCYIEEGKEPEKMPSAAEVKELKARGVQRLWGWPYFLTDECDDGYKGTTSGLSQSETRYIKHIVDIGRELGLNGMVANAFASNIFAETLNLYAFGQFCQEPELTPEAVIQRFSLLVSEPATAVDLEQVIRYIENQSTWQSGLPEKYRLPDFTVEGIQNAEEAQRRLSTVTARAQWPWPMPKSPADYIDKLQERLSILVEEEAKPAA